MGAMSFLRFDLSGGVTGAAGHVNMWQPGMGQPGLNKTWQLRLSWSPPEQKKYRIPAARGRVPTRTTSTMLSNPARHLSWRTGRPDLVKVAANQTIGVAVHPADQAAACCLSSPSRDRDHMEIQTAHECGSMRADIATLVEEDEGGVGWMF